MHKPEVAAYVFNVRFFYGDGGVISISRWGAPRRNRYTPRLPPSKSFLSGAIPLRPRPRILASPIVVSKS